MYFKELHRILTIFRAYLLGYSHFTQTMLSLVLKSFFTYDCLLFFGRKLFQKSLYEIYLKVSSGGSV